MSPNLGSHARSRVMTLLAARDRRLRATPALPTNAFRVVNGAADGAPPGLVVDAYGPWLVVGARDSVPLETVQEWAECAQMVFEPEGIVIKRLAPRPKDSFSRVLSDRPPPEVLKIFEGDASFEVHLDDGVQTGLFLDHRDMRARCREWAQSTEVLNLFAYTCAFSVHAALAGAKRVTSVDISQRALSWGRRNMALNDVNANDHRWFSDDVLTHLKRPRHSYGLVICDPPVFGHGRRPFSLERDLHPLLEGCMRQLAEGGVLIFSTHHLSLTQAILLDAARTAAGRMERSLELLSQSGLPTWDHPTLAQSVEGDRGGYLNTVVVRLES